MTPASDYMQVVIRRAAMIATSKAMNGHPLSGITWIPPQSATEDPMGMFVLQEHEGLTASETPPWE
jgi:hypothetical protein